MWHNQGISYTAAFILSLYPSRLSSQNETYLNSSKKLFLMEQEILWLCSIRISMRKNCWYTRTASGAERAPLLEGLISRIAWLTKRSTNFSCREQHVDDLQVMYDISTLSWDMHARLYMCVCFIYIYIYIHIYIYILLAENLLSWFDVNIKETDSQTWTPLFICKS